MRNNKDALLSVLESFIHDPLLEWTKKSKKTIDQGRFVLSLISHKLDGGLGLTYEFNMAHHKQDRITAIKQIQALVTGSSRSRVPATFKKCSSVEVQTRELITQAVDLDNLSKMWIGWSAYY